MNIIYVLIALAVLAVAVIFIYNNLVRAKVRVEEAWSDITVQLKRRSDLIPNLIDTVKGYAKHEQGVFKEVTEARAGVDNAEGVKETAQAENMMQQTLKSLFAVAENYPDLKANENFKHLQEELVDTEDKIQAARRFYNGSTRDFNIKVTVFPTNLIAGMLGFEARDFFEVDESEAAKIAEAPEVKF